MPSKTQLNNQQARFDRLLVVALIAEIAIAGVSTVLLALAAAVAVAAVLAVVGIAPALAQTEAVLDALGKIAGKTCDTCCKVPQTLSLR